MMDSSKLLKTRWFPLLLALAVGTAVLAATLAVDRMLLDSPRPAYWLPVMGALLAAVSAMLAWHLARMPLRLQTAFHEALESIQVTEIGRAHV